MSLYSGFNALGLSTSINDLWNKRNAERQARINNMGDTLFKIFNQMDANEKEAEEKARYEAEKAEEKSRYDAEQARIAQEKAEAKADLENRRAGAVKALIASGYSEDDANTIANSFSNPDNAVVESITRRKEDRTNKQNAVDRVFGFLKDRILANDTMASEDIPTRDRLEKRKEMVSSLQQFANENPDYNTYIKEIIGSIGNDGEVEDYTKDDAMKELWGLQEEDDDGIFSTPSKLSALRDKMIDKGWWTKLMKDSKWLDKWEQLEGIQRGDKLLRESENYRSKVDTAEDAKGRLAKKTEEEIQSQAEQKVKEEGRKGDKAVWPNYSDARLKKLWGNRNLRPALIRGYKARLKKLGLYMGN